MRGAERPKMGGKRTSAKLRKPIGDGGFVDAVRAIPPLNGVRPVILMIRGMLPLIRRHKSIPKVGSIRVD